MSTLHKTVKNKSMISQVISKQFVIVKAFEDENTFAKFASIPRISQVISKQFVIAKAFEDENTFAKLASIPRISQAISKQFVIAKAFEDTFAWNNFANSTIKIYEELTKLTLDYNKVIADFSSIRESLNLKESFLSEKVIREYFETHNIDDKEGAEIKAFVEQINSCDNVENTLITPSQKKFFEKYIFPTILGFFFFYLQQPNINIINNFYTTNNYKVIINNYYIKEQGLDKKALNGNNIMFVIKPKIVIHKRFDNSSKIVEELYLGDTIKVIDKYKKWVKVQWADEEENEHSGWVQNWKLSKFK